MSTVASTHYRVLSTVASAEIFSEEWLGRPEVHHTTNGDVPKEGCDADAISETEIQNAVVRAINKTLGGREQFLVQLQHNIEDVLNCDSTATLEYIDRRMAELQEKLVLCVNKNAEQEMLKTRIEEMRQFLQTQSSRVTEYDEQMVRRLIEKITVFDNKLIFEFKSGMTLELKR